MNFRKTLLATDPASIYRIVQDTGFFREEEAVIARELAEETLASPHEYEFIFVENGEEACEFTCDTCTRYCEVGEPIAYICYAEIPGTVGSYELYWLAVLKEYQRQGIGKKLIATAEDDIKSRKGRLIYISTSGSELYNGTRAVYERAGYSKAAVLKDFYLPGDDEVIFVKKLG